MKFQLKFKRETTETYYIEADSYESAVAIGNEIVENETLTQNGGEVEFAGAFRNEKRNGDQENQRIIDPNSVYKFGH